MALDENIYKLRLEKLKQIESLGQQAYPSKYDFTRTIPQILADYSAKPALPIKRMAMMRPAIRTPMRGVSNCSAVFAE